MTPFGEAPRSWKAGTYCYGSGLTLKIAKKMLDAGEKEALKQGVPMAMAISDSGGNLLVFRRMDDTILGSIQIALDKAYTAVFGKQPTGNYTQLYQSGQLVPLFFHERWITFPGGYPISREGVIYGGLGVSGGVIEDCYVAKAILQAGGFNTDDLDQFIADCEAELKKSKK
jgi:cob(I)alamin adenosyltransferase